mmetsp:Transcript_81049/g.262496  ORF Transcript_81049/g.262496 Transcript_81049/m.262496 type:complete len:200 (-) Transcript_81049:197-796(-)
MPYGRTDSSGGDVCAIQPVGRADRTSVGAIAVALPNGTWGDDASAFVVVVLDGVRELVPHIDESVPEQMGAISGLFEVGTFGYLQHVRVVVRLGHEDLGAIHRRSRARRCRRHVERERRRRPCRELDLKGCIPSRRDLARRRVRGDGAGRARDLEGALRERRAGAQESRHGNDVHEPPPPSLPHRGRAAPAAASAAARR